MQKSYCVLLFISLAFITSCGSSKHASSSKKLQGTWQSTPIVVDGNSNDWPSPYPAYDAKAMIGYAMSNDKSYLYLTVETGDEKTQMKILRGGLIVWIDTTDGKNQDISIAFPLQSTGEPMNYEKQQGQQQDIQLQGQNRSTARIKRALDEATQLTLQGFKGCQGGYSVIQKNDCGIMVKIGIDEYNELIWEAAIPFKALYGKDSIDKADIGKPVSICYAIKGLKKPAGANSNNGNHSGGADIGSHGMGGGGMGEGGGMHRGGSMSRGGSNSQSDNLFESTKTWRQFGLAYQ
ncbi:MAG TPA: hypothetical protein VN721_10820 [Flavipsychrobacter sp.]|nr:hypothetical protein [Flavipsychrobacter sp.]